MEEEFGEESNLKFVPSLTWVKRGVAKAEPDKIKLTREELASLLRGDAGSDEENEDSSSRAKGDSECFEKDDVETKAVGGFAGLTVYASNKDDPYITLPSDSDDDSDKEDEIIKPSDNLIVVGLVEKDQAVLEIYVYNEEEGSLYVHHDLLLPDMPLCVEWLNYNPSSAKDCNLVAVGGMLPMINIMDLDVVNGLEPVYTLGSADFNGKDPVAAQFKKAAKKGKSKPGHKAAVLDLSWNKNFTHVLASGSVDETVILWDLESASVNSTLDAFREKVQTIEWHPFEGQSLLTGSCDKAARVFDCRSKNSYKAWSLPGEAERVIWDNYNPFCFLASTDQGSVHYIDCRSDNPVWDLSAHSCEVTGLSLSSSCPGFLFTASNRGELKVWDIQEGAPVHIWDCCSRLGKIQCLAANPDSPFIMCAGGDNKALPFRVYNLSDKPEIVKRFSERPRLVPTMKEVRPVAEDDLSGPSCSKTSVMDTVATAMDDLCLSLNQESKMKKFTVKKIDMKATKKKKKKKVVN